MYVFSLYVKTSVHGNAQCQQGSAKNLVVVSWRKRSYDPLNMAGRFRGYRGGGRNAEAGTDLIG